ncbi:tyrosine--tRNA ligase [Donghicola eburneus]|uniref:Tyrosine--tRNA ligase n=1 Tax=Donghicola eburneus TaxID=393278 RepID=A0A1M4MWC4_9RHOB|nr:tyrosine--tRNA ligase [Donghicola eburneus]SCM65944.1 Tyrosine-tRNA ligase [Donghicola eburneus]
MDFANIIEERGFVHACSNTIELRKELEKGCTTAYIGYDATASSLHVGHLVNLMLLRWFQKCGHRPITLMGGGTTKVGDPSFRNAERPLLDDAAIAANIEKIKTVFRRFLDYDAGLGSDAIMANNSFWLDSLNYLGFLRDIGKHFSVNRMLSFDSVKDRLDTQKSLSFLEFNYMILQAYDFLELFRQHGCVLQMGGSDQWGNIVNGIDLVRRVHGQEVFAVTTPLLTDAAGNKIGKSNGKAVWLNPAQTSSFEFWQYWRNTPDDKVLQFLKLFTELPIRDCEALTRKDGKYLNAAKKTLADEVTAICHGHIAVKHVHDLRMDGVNAENLNVGATQTIRLGEGISILRLASELRPDASGKVLRRLITGGGVRIDGKIFDEPASEPPLEIGQTIFVSIGKQSRWSVEIV